MAAKSQKGFTIVELMISTAIFSSILLIILTAVTQIGRMYFKGVTITKTQEATRSIVDRIAQEIQYSPSSSVPREITSTSNTKRAICVGRLRMIYVLDQFNNGSTYGLWSDDEGIGSNVCDPASGPAALEALAVPTTGTNAKDLLPESMRIVNFRVVNATGNLYTVTLRTVYGETELLDQTAGLPNTSCKGVTAGTQFCAVSELSVTVNKRL